ncbi:germ cell nuclear acidic protein-like [Mantella aurantiaca]
MFSKGGKGVKSRVGMKTSVISASTGSHKAVMSLQAENSPVFISDSDEDSIIIRSTWSDRHKTNRNPKDKVQRTSSVPKNAKESSLDLQHDKYRGDPESTERPKVPQSKYSTPVSSDDEFECLMDRIKNRTKNQTPGSTASKAKAKSVLTEPVKIPCLDLTIKKKTETKPRPQSCSDFSRSPYFPPGSIVTEPLDDMEESRPGKTGFPCKVQDCFLENLSHPTSQYVKEFKQKKHELTSRLYRLYNLTIFDEKLPNNLEILWNKKMRKTAGYCVTGQRKIPNLQRYARIELSEKVCDSADRLRDTLIHEICHAATWLINGVRDGHGQYWRLYARKATLIHPELPMVTRCHTYEINYKFTYECSRCKNTIGRHSKSLDTERFVCALCKGKLVLQTANRKDGSPARTQLTPFARFVKENYGSMKREQSGLSHGDVMRKLSADFSSKTKISD